MNYEPFKVGDWWYAKAFKHKTLSIYWVLVKVEITKVKKYETLHGNDYSYELLQTTSDFDSEWTNDYTLDHAEILNSLETKNFTKDRKEVIDGIIKHHQREINCLKMKLNSMSGSIEYWEKRIETLKKENDKWTKSNSSS